MKSLKKKIANLLLDFKSDYLFQLAKLYVDCYQGDGNADMKTNGEFLFLNKFISKNNIEVVFDVGANVGEYTGYVLQFDDKLDIHCFEPSPSAFRKLKSRFRQSNIHFNNIALSNKSGRKTLYQRKGISAHSSFYKTGEYSKSNISSKKVITTTLDKYCKTNSIKRIDLLKIDTEGHEFAILEGARRMLKNQVIDIVQFEFGNASTYAQVFFKDFVDLFSKYNYEIYKIMPMRIEKVVYGIVHERCSYANFLAIRKGLGVP